MSDTSRGNHPSAPPPPPAPPLPAPRIANRAASALARFAPSFIAATRPAIPLVSRQDDQARGHPLSLRSSSHSSKTVTHRTGIPISAVDISPQRTHAIVAGREILKTLRVDGDTCTEDFNVRAAIINYASTVGNTSASRRKEQLAATDVKWSHGDYDKTIAAAGSNGRIVIYDLHRAGVELVQIHEHHRQVHRLAFNPVRPAVLLSGSQDATAKLFDLRVMKNDKGVITCTSQQRFAGNNEAIRDLRWRPFDGHEFATSTDAGVIQRWDIRNEKAPVLKINAHQKACHSIDWHPDGQHVLSAGVDGLVKIWDFGSAERRQKPLRTIRAPQAVMNARWRPPCWSSDTQDSGDWQSTQFVTSYPEIDPRIHLWDLTRPHIPFREFDRFENPCTDMLWHSKDLLWTVGNEGMFVQTDIHFAPQVVQRRSLSVVHWSSASGRLRLSAQKRPKRRLSGLDEGTADFLMSSAKDRGSSGEKPGQSRSFTDDTLDENFLSTSFRKRHGRVSSSRPSKSLGGTPPSAEEYAGAMALEKTLEKCGTFRAFATEILDLAILGASTSRPALKHFAQSNESLFQDHQLGPDPALLLRLESGFEKAAKLGEQVLMFRLAQSWRIVGFSVMGELEKRANARVQARIEQAENEGDREQARLESELEMGAHSGLLDSRPDKVKNHLFRGVVEAEGYGHNGSADMDSTSNMTTPLARPLPDSPLSTHTYNAGQSPLRTIPLNDEELRPLPPSLLHGSGHALDSRLSKRRPLDHHLSPLSLDDDEPVDTLSFKSLNERFDEKKRSELTRSSISPLLPPAMESMSTTKSANNDKTAPRAIEGKAAWRSQKSQVAHSPSTGSLERRAEERRAALSDYKAQPRHVLNYGSPSEAAQARVLRGPFDRHDSAESFPMFSASTDSSHRLRSMGGSFPASHQSDGSDPLLEDWEVEEAIAQGQIKSDPLPASDLGADTPSDESPNLFSLDSIVNSLTDNSVLASADVLFNIYRPQPPLLPLKELAHGGVHTPPPEPEIEQYLASDFLPQNDNPVTAEYRGVPWSAHQIINRVLQFYTQTLTDVHLPAQLISRIQPYLNRNHELVSRQVCEQILSAYNDILIRLGLVIEAAELRKVCAPLYPAVYDYAQDQQATYIGVYCHTCNKPFENHHRDNFRCERCSSKQAPCPICLSVRPPAEWAPQPDRQSTNKGENDKPTVPRLKGSGLWYWCQGCGHGAHVACMQRWLANTAISEGGCPSQGCLHDCGPGPRREEKQRRRADREAQRSKGRPKRDSWVVSESSAVQRTRSVLVNQQAASDGVGNAPQGSGSAAGTATPTTSGMTAWTPGGTSTSKETKKVRLVIPSEEDVSFGLGASGNEQRSAGPGPPSEVGGGRRKGGLLRWQSDVGRERDRDRDKDGETPLSRLGGMAASVE